MKKLIIPITLTLFSVAHAASSPKVVYGIDNRKDVYESKDSVLVELSKSTAAMISASSLKKVGREFLITGESLKDRFGLCPDAKFGHQVASGNCSGFLVADKYLVSAGHCYTSPSECSSYKWVFDYHVNSAEQVSVKVPESSVYGCKKVVSHGLDNITQQDFVVVELDRPVQDREPLAFRRSGKITVGESLAVIGHPDGLPTKIADGAKVRKLDSLFFVSNLDTFHSNSGSAVFNMKTSEVEGILVRGEDDYEFDAQRGCTIVKKCSETGCRGEDVTYINNVEFIKNLKGTKP